jgi:phosphate transport system permease protein
MPTTMEKPSKRIALPPISQSPEHIRLVADRRAGLDKGFLILGWVLVSVSLGALAVLLGDLVVSGMNRIDGSFLVNFPSRKPENAGILSAWVGSALLMVVTASVAVPMGVAAGLYLEEYGKKNLFNSAIEINITNLAAVPSIIYGLMALGLFIYVFKLGGSVLTGGLTLGLLVLPIVIVATREAVRAIPQPIREAAYALGASRWQVIWHHLLPYSAGSIMTGVIMAMSRAIGETAPLITIGALTFIAFLPPAPVFAAPVIPFGDAVPGVSLDWVMTEFTALPIQMFNWVSRPQVAFAQNAAAAGLVLMTATLVMNAAAIYIRYRVQRSVKW